MFIISLILIAVLVAVDQVIKFVVVDKISLNQVIDVISLGGKKIFSLTHIRNSGAAWSMMEGKTWFLVALPIVVCAAAFIYMYKIRKGSKFELAALALLVAGGLGNLIDRIRLHEVVDYILFEPVDFPIFNFADICVVIGAIMFCISMLFGEISNKKKVEKPVESDSVSSHEGENDE